MAHKFGSFSDAYTYLSGKWAIAKAFQVDAYSRADAGQWKWAIYATLSAFDTLLENYGFGIESSVYGECLYWAAQSGGGGVSMDDMLNAMLSADFDQLQKFIGLVDAYRIAIWNAPFNAEWYASLARGFIKWP